MGVGYRQDSLNWNIGSPTGHPDVLSELSWKNLRMIDYQAAGIYRGCAYVRMCGDYGQIYDGTVRDSDWAEDGRKGEYSRFIGNANKGEAFDLSLGIGNRTFSLKGLLLTPLIGFAWQEQHLRIMDSDEGVHSNYRSKWYSPWLGFDFEAKMTQKWALFGALEGHLSRYRGTGHWNLREEFVEDFQNRAWGYGIVGKLALNYAFNCYFSAGVLGEYQNHSAKNGWDSIKIKRDFGVFTTHQPFNSVRWQSGRILANITLKW